MASVSWWTLTQPTRSPLEVWFGLKKHCVKSDVKHTFFFPLLKTNCDFLVLYMSPAAECDLCDLLRTDVASISPGQ